jgi:prepilin-type processing-associated H-X9-DG protein
MKLCTRSAFTLFQLLTVLALLAIAFGLFLPAVAKVRASAARIQSANNLKQIALAGHSYYDAIGMFPPGCDDNHFSTSAYLLPYIEQDNVFKLIDMTKPCDDKANETPAAVLIKTFLNPTDGAPRVDEKFGMTSYLFNAGSQPDLKDNDGIFYLNSKTKFPDITDGTSNTVYAVETLRGDGKTKAEDMHRQHVSLKKDDLKDIADDAGAKYWKDDKSIVGDRGARWIDGRFLQGTFNARLKFNEDKPDLTCNGAGGLSGVRTLTGGANAAMCDGSVRFLSEKISLETWRAAATRAGGEVLGPDF